MPTSQNLVSSRPLIKDTACFDTGSETIMLSGFFELDSNFNYRKSVHSTVEAVSSTLNYQIGDILEKVDISTWSKIDCCPM